MLMLRWLFRWLVKIVAALAVLFAVVYVGDWAVYRLRGSPQSKVTVNRFVSIPEKGRKTEFDFLAESMVLSTPKVPVVTEGEGLIGLDRAS